MATTIPVGKKMVSATKSGVRTPSNVKNVSHHATSSPKMGKGSHGVTKSIKGTDKGGIK